MEEYYGIAAFRSRQSVLRFEEALRRAGLNVRVVSTPRDIALGCGLSVMFPIERLATVRGVLEYNRPANMIGLYEVDKRPGARARLRAVSL